MTEKETGFGFVGRWIDGKLGWSMPRFICPIVRSEQEARRYTRSNMNDADWAKESKHYLCRITIEPVFDSLGRPIVAIPRKEELSDDK